MPLSQQASPFTTGRRWW